EMERELTEALGTRVAIEPKENGGKLTIDFMSEDDLRTLFSQLASRIASTKGEPGSQPATAPEEAPVPDIETTQALDDRSKEEKKIDENTFNPANFSI
ncbi:MAG TPA: hypothetical protein VD928_01445, partial [Candidatus Paceibacterota bacterium]|nr:hypothetical protein [Candidatus Paceibacterota bacterium]